MSDSTKTILWIALAVVVILVIVWVVMSSRRRRVNDERRFQAGELRAEAQEKAPLLQKSADRASVTERIAADARAEADEKEATAATLEDQAHAQRAAADAVKAERDDLAREADRIDPDVTTDDEGHRVGQQDEDGGHGSQQEGEEPTDRDQRAEAASSTIAPTAENTGAPTAENTGAPTAENTGVLGGASTLDDPDDEPDLADAQDPFATAGDEGAAAGYDEDMKRKKKRSTAQTETPGSAAVSADLKAADAVQDRAADETGPVTDDDARDHAVTGDAAPVDDATQAAGDLETDPEERADEADAAEQASAGDSPQVATATQPTEVSVPALDERDDVLVAGGPPDNDPGDHRGQPWATTPGEPGLDQGDEVADNTDEGFAAHTPSEAAPDTHTAPDTDTDTEAVGDTGDHRSEQHGSASSQDDLADAATSETAAPAQATDAATADSTDDVSEATSPASESSNEPADEPSDTSPADESSQDAEPDEAPSAEAQTSAERRIAGFDEVIDGGYGIGSASPIDDGAQPLAHPVKAWTDRKSFAAPGDEGYDGAEPDVWFYNEDAARRAGFSRDGD